MDMNKVFKETKAAYSKVPFYYNLAQSKNIDIESIIDMDSFKSLPLIEKEDVLNNFEDMISAGYQVGDNNKKLSVIQTSGSSGECLNVFWTFDLNNYSLIDLWVARKKRYGISTTDKSCRFYYGTTQQEKIASGVKFTVDEQTMAFDRKGLDESKMLQVYKMMIKYETVWIMMWPSIALMLMQCMKRYNLPEIESLRYIELTGEYISKELEDELREHFGCKIANQYGTTETNSIAYECEYGHMHCMNSNVYVEILKDGKDVPNGEYGDVYVTTLKKNAMPFIRYGVGDSARLIDGSICRCGNCNPIIELKSARNTDWVYHKDGTRTSAYDIVNAIEYLNDRIWMIRKFQIVQTDYNEFDIYIETSKLFKMQKKITYEILAKGFMSAIKNPKLSSCKYNFNFCESIELDKNGKFKTFIAMDNSEV